MRFCLALVRDLADVDTLALDFADWLPGIALGGLPAEFTLMLKCYEWPPDDCGKPPGLSVLN